MFQQQKKRAGRRGQRRMPVDLETPNAFAAKMRRRSDTPPFVRTPKCSATPALCADAPCAEPLGGARHRGRSVARSVRFAIASEAPDGAHDALSRTRGEKLPPPPGGALRQGPSAARTRSPHFSLHSSLHSTARNLQLGARIATRNPQLASKCGRPVRPRDPKMRLISVQMLHVKHSTLNLRFSHARRPPPRRHPSVGCRAVRTLASPAAAHRTPSATHVEPRPPRPLRPPRRLPHRDTARPPHAADPAFAPIAAQRDSRRTPSASRLLAIASNRSWN